MHITDDCGEKTLATELRRGDASALSRFYALYAGSMAGVCSRYVANDDDAKDVFQEAMVKIVQNAARFEYRGPGSLKAWAMRIAANEAVSFLRNRRKADFAALPADGDVADTPDGSPDVADIPPEAIHGMIRELPDGYRTVFNLYAIEGKSHREIASALGIKEATSASQFLRARRMLARKIEEYRKRNDN